MNEIIEQKSELADTAVWHGCPTVHTSRQVNPLNLINFKKPQIVNDSR